MKSISITDLSFANPIEFKIVCEGYGLSHKHYFVFCSRYELFSTLSTLRVYGFNSFKVFIKADNGIYSISVEL